MIPFQIASEPLPVTAHNLGFIFEMPITNTMTMYAVNIIFFIIIFLLVNRFRIYNPGKFQIFVEYLFKMITGLISQVAGDETIAKKIMPLVFSLIILILVSDLLLTFLPILTGITYLEIPAFRSHTNDFNTTFALATISMIAVHMFSIIRLNPFFYVLRYVKIDRVIQGFRKGISQGMMSIIDFFIGILDIISEFARLISLSLRLFGNMFAGELLQGILMGMFAFLLPLPIIGLSLLTGTIQAIVFGALVSSYLTGALKDDN
jgi:F-type H+-transporting ATPase subunit a